MPVIRSNSINNYEERTGQLLREQLFNFNSDLRKLKYDPSSNQPYIQKKLPAPGETPQNNFGPDVLLRGGLLQPIRAVEDVSRLGKFFTDTQNLNGLLFAANQNLLSQIGVQTQAQDGVTALNEGAYLPTSTLLQAGAGTLNGIHFNKQGLNPFGGDNLFGLTLPGGLPEYTTEVAKEDERLVRLTTEKIGFIDVETHRSILPTSPEGFLYDYRGGPKSAGGFGRTTIGRFSDTITKDRGSLRNFTNLSPDPIGIAFLSEYRYIPQNGQGNPFVDPENADDKIPSYSTTEELANKPSFTPGDEPTDFRDNTLNPDYSRRNFETRVNIGSPGSPGDKSNFQTGRSDKRGTDKINASPIYSSYQQSIGQEANDFAKFRIESVDSGDPFRGKFMNFRAFIESFEDSYTGEWASQQYMGRADKFYRYQGFDRQISISWKMAALSKQELMPMYHKLNYLASNTSPDYVNSRYMGGPLMKLTVGGYLYRQPGFITSLTLTVPQESPWEIAIPVEGGANAVGGQSPAFVDNTVKEMPHYMDVSMAYTPIHEFVPRKNSGNNGIEGDQRYIALNNGFTNGYETY